MHGDTRCRRELKVRQYDPCLTILILLSRCSFGYVVEGADFLSDVDEGDIIVSAKVTKGAENLLLPSTSS
jgi:hypothetical protein